MTKRSVVLGLLAGVVMGAYGQYMAKYIPGWWGLVRGSLPVSVFGGFVFFVIVVNPLLARIRASFRLKPGEIALIMGFVLIGCGVADAGMMRMFPRTLITPIQEQQLNPGWQERQILQYTPDSLLANEGEYDAALMDGYYSSAAPPGEILAFSDVPWEAWWRPLAIWGSLIGLFMLASVCLSVVVHRQWADKERLRYPLAEIATSLLRTDPDGKTSILRNRVFWVGLAVPFTIRMINYVQHWVPESIHIPLRFDFSAIRQAFPEFMQTPGASHFANPTLHPVAIGLAFLLASDISLSIGIANVLSVGILFFLIQFGVDLSSSHMQGGYLHWQSFGAFLAMAAMIVYVGRRYYWQTAKQALTFVPQKETVKSGVWGLRLFLVCMILSVGLLSAVGVDVSIAALGWLVMVIMVLVAARLNAESGTFFFQPGWQMPGIMVGLFGLTTLGPTAIIVMGMMMYFIQVEVWESMMPFVVNGLKISSDASGKAFKVGKVGLLFGIGVALIVVVTIPTALWADYHHPAALRRGWSGEDIWSTANTAVTELTLAGELETVQQYSGLQRFANMRPDRRFLTGLGVGFVSLILLSALRLRFAWWPLHPVILLIFNTSFAGRFGFSFLLGWLIKSAVTKFGGGQKYLQVKPIMLGLIVGDLAGGFTWMAINGLYYVFTSNAAPGHWDLLW